MSDFNDQMMIYICPHINGKDETYRIFHNKKCRVQFVIYIVILLVDHGAPGLLRGIGITRACRARNITRAGVQRVVCYPLHDKVDDTEV